jgi:predicted small secreted protein
MKEKYQGDGWCWNQVREMLNKHEEERVHFYPEVERIHANRARITARRARMLSALFFGLAAIVMFLMWTMLSGCATNGTGEDVHLTGKAGEIFRSMTGAEAMTVSERVTIYGSEDPPDERLRCHEGIHAAQAKVIADALVAIGAIDDDELTRASAWIAVYSIEYAQRGYVGSKFEVEARDQCKHLEQKQ